MKTLATLFLICFAVFLNAQLPLPNDTLNQTDSLNRKQGYWKITPLIQKQYGAEWNLNSVVEEGRYVDNRKQGKWIMYYPSGVVRLEAVYKNNRPAGPYKLYYESAHLKETGYFKNSRYMGEYRLYYESDTLHRVLHFDSTGRRQGPQFYYYPNGKLQLQCNLIDGKEDGWVREYYEDGTLKSETYYVNGYVSTDSTARNYPPRKIPDPRPKPPVPPTPTPHKDFCNEYAVLYNSNQQIAKRGTFKNCKLVDGEERLYDANGLLMQIRLYRDGKYVGDSPLPTEEPTNQPECARVITEKQKKLVDSTLHTIPCYHYNDSLKKAQPKAPGYDESSNWNGSGWAILYKCNVKEFEGWFTQYRLICGVQYIFDPNGVLVRVKFYEEGKLSFDADVPQ